MAQKQVVTVEGHRITLTNLDKVLYPETGTTKGDVLAYYAAIAGLLIPHAADRPVTRKRWVNGVGTAEHPGEMFFQKNLDASTPPWVQRRSIHHKDHTNVYPLLNDAATLTWLGQIAALELHVPQWRFDARGNPQNPDRLVLDLDPGTGATLTDCAEVARYCKAILADRGLKAMPVTSGSKGIHLYAALDGSQTSDQVSAVAHELARALEADHPELVVSDMKKSLRTGKVLVDWSQNNAAKTTITPYSLRGRVRPTVAVPRTWRELAAEDLAQLDYKQVLDRMRTRKDPLVGFSGGSGRGEPAGRPADGEVSAVAVVDRLEKYRSKRDSSKTPEPVPEAAAGASDGHASDGHSFVIQEHHASRLHYDFRLEHDGVLVSWALPKGVPTDSKRNHLAVQTEEHPLEYGSFEGTIPKGEYGAGVVTIWDAGWYELEKWRDGEEVIVTVHGKAGGGLGSPRKYALIHTGGEGKAAQNWLIHLMSSDSSERHRAKQTKPVESDVRASAERAVERGRQEGGAPARTSAPMFATLGSEQEFGDREGWAFEMKWDGIRAIATVAAGQPTRLTSRNGIDITVGYPEITAQLGPCIRADSAILDGEIVALNKEGRPDFGLLQTRMKLTEQADVDAAVARVPIQFMLFDILASNGRSLTSSSYDDRRSALERVVQPGGVVQVPPAFEGNLEGALRTSRELGLEGVMAKDRSAPYRSGRRSTAWIKIKHHRTQEVVVGGWRPGRGRRAGSVGSLLMGIPDGSRLKYIGRVGTGFRDRELAELTELFARRTRKTTPFSDVPRQDAADAHWITPTLVGEVEFAEWTPDGRLRQPSWRGWRPDKAASEVVRES